jgi:hypothetical protein
VKRRGTPCDGQCRGRTVRGPITGPTSGCAAVEISCDRREDRRRSRDRLRSFVRDLRTRSPETTAESPSALNKPHLARPGDHAVRQAVDATDDTVGHPRAGDARYRRQGFDACQPRSALCRAWSPRRGSRADPSRSPSGDRCRRCLLPTSSAVASAPFHAEPDVAPGRYLSCSPFRRLRSTWSMHSR